MRNLSICRIMESDWILVVEHAVEEACQKELVGKRMNCEQKSRKLGFWFAGDMEKLLKEIHELKIYCRINEDTEVEKTNLRKKQNELEVLWSKKMDKKAEEKYVKLELDRCRNPRDFWKAMDGMAKKDTGRKKVYRIVTDTGDVVYGKEAQELVEDRLVSLIRENKEMHSKPVIDAIEKQTLWHLGMVGEQKGMGYGKMRYRRLMLKK